MIEGIAYPHAHYIVGHGVIQGVSYGQADVLLERRTTKGPRILYYSASVFSAGRARWNFDGFAKRMTLRIRPFDLCWHFIN